MYNSKLKQLLITICMLICPLLSEGQDLADLPKLFPSYSEDFTDYKSYPSICFERAFLDDNGRLWLLPCRPVRANNRIFLFQFDGYEFRQVIGELATISQNCSFHGLYKGQELLGSTSTARGEPFDFFLFDLRTYQREKNRMVHLLQ